MPTNYLGLYSMKDVSGYFASQLISGMEVPILGFVPTRINIHYV